MTESFLQYIWKFQLFNKNNLRTTAGENISVLKTGEHNTDAGPDFFNSKIKIGKTIWAGNIEIHLKSSDWKNHSHDKNSNYENVILHVVWEDDEIIKRKDGSIIPTLELTNLTEKNILSKYESMMGNSSWIPCGNLIHLVDNFVLENRMHRLIIERLENKTKLIEGLLHLNKNNWEETFYQSLARNFGLKINSEPFELLAKSLPLKILAKHKNNLLQIEALLFGQAGMLEKNFDDEYPSLLKKEYVYLKKKYALSPIQLTSWKFLRLMPANFPTIRIAQFAQLTFQSTHLFSKVLETKNVKEIEKYFSVSLSPYWETHYLFEKISPRRKKYFGKSAVHILIINTIVSVLFIYGKLKGIEEHKEKALKLLEQLPPEKNNIIKKWEAIRVTPNSAYQSQALLELKNNYCDKKLCLQCEIGNKILKS